jgi:hypothetical protein
MDDAISQSEAAGVRQRRRACSVAPQPPAELVLERNKRAAKLAHVLSTCRRRRRCCGAAARATRARRFRPASSATPS